MRKSRIAAALVLACAGTGFLAPSASAQWPAGQPIKVIVPFSPGSATDIIARTVFDEVSAKLGQVAIVENRVGAGGTIGANAVAKAEPDGYTLLVHSSSHSVTPSTYAKLPYDTANDFVAILPIANLPNVLVVAKAKGYKSAKDLVGTDKAKTGKLNYASAGSGSAAHLTAERFRMAAKIEAQHVPFRGAPEALREIVADRVDFYFCPLLPAQPLIQSGELTALAVSSSQRASALPDVPTTIEAGFPNSNYDFWVGVLAPRKTPSAVVDRLSKEIAAALTQPLVKEKLARLGADPMPMTPAQFESLIQNEIKMNGELVKTAGIKPIE